jgi:tetratricopeptide (TPR) repeat protein
VSGLRRITIREVAASDDGFDVVIDFEGGGEHRAAVADPFAEDDRASRLLTWYFEEHLELPFLDHDRASAAEQSIVAYGEALFADLFASSAACARELRRARDDGLDGWRIEIVGSPAFHRLHWEALHGADASEDPTPLGILLPIVRRVQDVGGFDVQPTGAALNVLVVTARPGGVSDVGYRTISRPLLESLRQAQVPVDVDLVRPGTWAALVDRLREATDRHGTGWYQVIHFDVHGAVAGGEELSAPAGDGFLYFETGEDGVAEQVDTARVAELLVEHRVPVAVMNACQSAMQPGESEASLAQRLVEAGVPLAVGMAYSVTVSAAELMMPVVYERLARGEEALGAIHASRRTLFERRARNAYFDQQLDLDDWLLPVVFSRREVAIQPRAATTEEAAAIMERQASRLDEPRPEYGFVGRDLDVQAIERAVLTDAGANELLVHGMAGAGKSALLEHLGWWWQTTGLVDRVFSYSYEDRAWSVGQILHSIATALLGEQAQAEFQALSDDLQIERVVTLLREERHLLVLDNAESIAADPTSTPQALEEVERARLERLLAKLRGGRTLVLLGSRGPEQWLAAETFGTNVHELGGLDREATSALVDRIFSRNEIAHPSTPDDRRTLDELVELLGSYPLMLTVVLPGLADSTPAELIAELTAAADGDSRRLSVERALEVSYRRLDPAVQSALLCLAPFASAIDRLVLERYAELLGMRPEVAALGVPDMPAALDAAIQVGLASAHIERERMIRLQPLLPSFLRTRLAGREELADALAETHYWLYVEVAREAYGLLKANDPEQRKAGVWAIEGEYANLLAAIAYALAADRWASGLVGVVDEYLGRTMQRHARRALLDTAIEALERSQTGGREQELAALRNHAGVAAVEDRRFDAARHHHTRELDLVVEIGDRHGQGLAHHQLGAVAQGRRRFDEAIEHYEEALETFVELGVPRRIAGVRHELGLIAQQQERFDAAEEHFEQAVKILDELGDHLGAATSLYHLGAVAEHQAQLERAEEHYGRALEIFNEFGDVSLIANCYKQLGTVAHHRGDRQRAETHYREALAAFVQIDDRHNAALAQLALGIALAEGSRSEEAERQLDKALETFVELDDSLRAAVAHKQLGSIAELDEERLHEAEAHYREAIEIGVELDEHYMTSQVGRRLTVVLTRSGRIEEAIVTTLATLLTGHKDGRVPMEGELVVLSAQLPIVGRERFHEIVLSMLGPEFADTLVELVEGVDTGGLAQS